VNVEERHRLMVEIFIGEPSTQRVKDTADLQVGWRRAARQIGMGAHGG
jgi:hypothetical protein